MSIAVKEVVGNNFSQLSHPLFLGQFFGKEGLELVDQVRPQPADHPWAERAADPEHGQRVEVSGN